MMYVVIAALFCAVCIWLALKVLAVIRQERLANRSREAKKGVPQQYSKLKQKSSGEAFAGTESPAAHWRQTLAERSWAKQLVRVGIDPEEGWLVGVVIGVAVLAGVGVFLAGGQGLLAVGVVLIVLVGAGMFGRHRRRLRRELFDEQLAHALPQITASVKGALTFERALRVALVHMDSPLKDEFARVLSDVAYGLALPEALESMALRTQCSDVKTLASAMKIRQGSGGSVATALSMVSSRVNARLKETRELKVEIAGTRMAKWFVAAALPGIFLLMYVSNADFAQFYATEPLGWTVLGVAAVLEVIGLALSQSITSLKQR